MTTLTTSNNRTTPDISTTSNNSDNAFQENKEFSYEEMLEFAKKVIKLK